MARAMSLASLCVFALAANCVEKNPVNSGSMIQNNVTLVNSAAQIKKVSNAIGRQSTDLPVLLSNDYIEGGMRLARVDWCTESSSNSGRLTMLKFTLASISNNTILLPLNSMGVGSTNCYSWTVLPSQQVQQVTVSYNDVSIQRVVFTTSDGWTRSMGFADPNAY